MAGATTRSSICVDFLILPDVRIHLDERLHERRDYVQAGCTGLLFDSAETQHHADARR
jgi:hypothetical protein